MEPVDLDLTGPNRDCPLAFDDDPGAPCAFSGDFFVADVAAPASSSPPPIGSTSAEEDRFREEVRGALQSLSASSANLRSSVTHDCAEIVGQAQFVRVTDGIRSRLLRLLYGRLAVGSQAPVRSRAAARRTLKLREAG